MPGKIRELINRWICFALVLLIVWPVWVLDAQTERIGDAVEETGHAAKVDGIEADDDEESVLSFFGGKIRLGMLAEAVIGYADISDVSDENSSDLWDAYIETLALSLRIDLTEWLSADFLAEVEDLGKQDELVTTSMSEAFITLQHPQFPVYLIGGIRTQPFGVFEDRMISGALTEELYEIVEPGATIGFAADFYGLDLSLTVYEGQAVMENLVDFKTHQFESGADKTNGINAYIIHLATEPVDDRFTFSVFYNSEPGRGRRNESVAAAFSYHFYGFIVDAEYITATERESGEDQERNLESAWILGLACQPVDFLQVAARYERFNDDHSGRQDGVVDHRYLAGLNYAITEYTTLSFEYRHSKIERQTDSDSADKLNEYQLQLSLEF